MFWNSTDSNTLAIYDAGWYNNHPHMTPTIPEGYNCDPLQSTSILFVGSCDLDGPISDTNKCWARLLHKHLTDEKENTPYIALGKLTAGFMSLPRRILTFCERYGPPKKIYAVVPRPVAIEMPLPNKQLVSVSDRKIFPNWLFKHKKINQEELNLLLDVSGFCERQLDNENYQIYKFEENSSFVKTICKLYGIKFNWTINLCDSSIHYYSKYLNKFLNNSEFMRETFLGVAEAKDFGFDGAMGDLSQYEVFKILSNPNTTNIQTMLNHNLNVVEKYKKMLP